MQENLWNNLIAGLPEPHLLQTYEWGQVKASQGWQALYLVWLRDVQGFKVFENLDSLAGLKPGDVLAAALVQKKKVIASGMAARL